MNQTIIGTVCRAIKAAWIHKWTRADTSPFDSLAAQPEPIRTPDDSPYDPSNAIIAALNLRDARENFGGERGWQLWLES